MKKIIFFILFSFQFLFAQQNILSINAENKTGSVETTFIINTTNDIQSGFRLTLPDGLRLVPVAVHLNQKPLWLQNGETVSEADSVATWNFVDSGLVFVFNPDQLASGDQLTIKTMAVLVRKGIVPDSAISIYPYDGDQALGSVDLPAALLGVE